MVEQGGNAPQIDNIDGVMKMFLEQHPNQENAGSYYDAMTSQAYDDFLILINFCDP